ncbi:NAD(P)-dependent alcohol dehydrogenase [Paraburkholderia agricolaris]|uniref:zinc-dependent alcohol dehydrogenase family protein n=1 Tax=Paraburkholderia agricolaris TaxID=2152888 RepID=UPI0038BE0195
MKAFQLKAGRGLSSLIVDDRSSEPLAPHEIRVQMEAAALNYRELQILDGRYGLPDGASVTPGSDGTGIVVEVGANVTRFGKGERVLPAFWPDWIDGPITPGKTSSSFGAGIRGTLAAELVAGEHAFVSAPTTLSALEAACLPCAGVTGWNALFVAGGLRPGATVLILGTGGVSVWALQLARASGLRPIVTSSSDEKLRRARELGAAETINYRTTADWAAATRELTGGRGVDLVIEVGGSATIGQSVASVRQGGTVIVVGGVAGTGGGLEPGSLIGGAVRLQGIMVGSRSMLEELVSFVDRTGLKPVVDRAFAVGETVHAFEALTTAGHFGKIAIDLNRSRWPS